MERSERCCGWAFAATVGVTLREAWGGQPRVAHGAASTAGTPFASEARSKGDRRPAGRHRSGSPAGEARRSANGSHSSRDRGVSWECWLWLASRVSWPCESCPRKRRISTAAQLLAAYSDRWEEAAVVASPVWGRAFVCDSTAARDREERTEAERAKEKWSTSSKAVAEKGSGPDLARTEAGSSG